MVLASDREPGAAQGARARWKKLCAAFTEAFMIYGRAGIMYEGRLCKVD